MLLSSFEPTDIATQRAIIEDGNEGLVRLYSDEFDSAARDRLRETIDKLQLFYWLAAAFAVLLALSMGLEASWQTRMLCSFIVAAVMLAGVVVSQVIHPLRKTLSEQTWLWRDVTKDKVVLKNLDSRQVEIYLRKASAFARDENTIIYYHLTRDDNCSDKHILKFGLPNEEARVLFRLKYV